MICPTSKTQALTDFVEWCHDQPATFTQEISPSRATLPMAEKIEEIEDHSRCASRLSRSALDVDSDGQIVRSRRRRKGKLGCGVELEGTR